MENCFKIGKGLSEQIEVGGSNLAYILGPCAIETRDHSMKMAEKIRLICDKLGIKFIFKACFDKDCRSSADSFHGVGIEEGLNILEEVKKTFNVPVVSDISVPEWANQCKDVLDLIQVPAYLCRQTSMLRAVAETGLPIHLKKGQFMSPYNMINSVGKLRKFGAKDIILTDRGTFLGYGGLVNDFTSLPIMSATGCSVGFDATHSIQMPTSLGTISGGQREFIPHLVRAAVAVGTDVIFMETHDNPESALSDPNTVLDLKYLEYVLRQTEYLHKQRAEMFAEIGGEYEIHQ
jgi:2-dehydro-3-deoxyphosphooctonate aldolase (KDO 8-P synthase)